MTTAAHKTRPDHLAAKLVVALADVLGVPGPDGIALHEPRFAGREWDLVKDCIDTGWVSTAGKYVPQFEDMVAQACGAQHAVSTINGTAALHLALMMAGVGPGDEVIIPALTFVATANAVSYCHAIPHFADVNRESLGMDPAKLAQYLERIADRNRTGCVNKRTRRQIRAIMPMHTFGHPVDMDGLLELAERFGLVLIEDATESIGSLYHGRQTGGIARIGTMSFNGNKSVTTGGGGAVIMNDEALHRKTKHISATAKQPHRWEFIHDAVGYNYRLPNINAALGVAQLESLPDIIIAKRRLAEQYRRRFETMKGGTFYVERLGTTANYWLNAFIMDKRDRALRDEILTVTNETGYGTRPIWRAMHELPMYAKCPRDDLSTTEDLVDRVINLPSSARHGFSLLEGKVF
jgi:perosamine synthetase